jgi:hypothetical protein
LMVAHRARHIKILIAGPFQQVINSSGCISLPRASPQDRPHLRGSCPVVRGRPPAHEHGP